MKRDNEMTKRFLTEAGIKPRMRVLEIGCGGGEVTQVLAELVGSFGTVVSLDKSDDALATARDRINDLKFEHVQLMTVDIAGDLSSLDSFQPGSFNVLVGRRVLMYLQDPVEVIQRLAIWIKSGGVVIFEETDAAMVPARETPLAAHDRAVDWLKRMLIAEGANTAMGFSLPATFMQAGLKFEHIRAEAVIQGQGMQYPLSTLLSLMKSRLVSSGIADGAEVEALIVQVEAESHDSTCVYISEMSFCAWARKP